MNSSNVSKLLLPAMLVAPGILFFAGCSSDDDPAVPAVVAPATGQGIWEGTMVSNQATSTDTYDLALVFYTPPSGTANDALVMGVITDPDTDQGVSIFDGNYASDGVDPADACDDATQDIVAGTAGNELRDFDFIDGSAGGPLQRGKFCLALDGNTLTGTVAYEEGGSFNVELQYTLADNVIDSNLDSLANKTWTDNEFGWSADTTDSTRLIQPGTATNPGMSAVVNSVDQTFTATALDGASTCTGTGKISDVAGNNIFLLGPIPILPQGVDSIIVENCSPAVDTLDVDGSYNGLGVLVKDDDGSDMFVTILTSYGAVNLPNPVTPARALYNVFR